MVRLTYEGEEYHYDYNGNGIPDRGDVMGGIAIITSITGVDSKQDYSHQLKNRELTVAFRFSITEGAINPMNPQGDDRHIEFSLLDGDFFRLYVGTGNRKNYNPLAFDAVSRATDGSPWVSMELETFFESVNDLQQNGSTLNRTWADLTTNGTRYRFLEGLFPTQLGFDPSHVYEGEARDDLAVQLYFENFIDGPSLNEDYSFAISGHFYMEAVNSGNGQGNGNGNN